MGLAFITKHKPSAALPVENPFILNANVTPNGSGVPVTGSSVFENLIGVLTYSVPVLPVALGTNLTLLLFGAVFGEGKNTASFKILKLLLLGIDDNGKR